MYMIFEADNSILLQLYSQSLRLMRAEISVVRLYYLSI